MKAVAILLLLALGFTGCGSSSSTNVEGASGGEWQSVMLGGKGPSSGFSFITQFTVSGGGGLSISSFQLENTGTCFKTAATTEGGTLNVTYNAADVVTGTFSFTITSAAGDTLTLTSSSVTGTFNTTTDTLSTGTIIGTWALTPASGSGCVQADDGTFTMTQTSSTTT
ncbi:MAG TPA: hypothetical protein VMQ67_03735 [Candidatus Saccharimonadales bacterium]|jgi:hypothetical protein|nr:hypothetical protein [Candidatus Saccharimonadales bacterium]